MLFVILVGLVQFFLIQDSETKVVHFLSTTTVNAIFNETAELPCKIKDKKTLGTLSQVEKIIWKRQSNNKYIIISDKRYIQDNRFNMKTQSFDSMYANMTINSVRLDDQGVYNCLFYKSGKPFGRNITLNVQIPAIIHPEGSSLSRITVEENNNLILRCNFTGKPQPSLVWLAAFTDGSGRRLLCKNQLATRRRSSPEEMDCTRNGSSITIRNIKRYMSGDYTCVADNQIKVQSSRNIEVEVTYKPEITMLNTKLGQYKNRHTLLQASLTGNPINSVYWMKGNKRIDATHSDCAVPVDEEKYCIRVDSKGQHKLTTTLWIFSLQDEDFDTYHCVATYPFGEVYGSAVITQTYEVISKWKTFPDSHLLESQIPQEPTYWNPSEERTSNNEPNPIITAAGQHMGNPSDSVMNLRQASFTKYLLAIVIIHLYGLILLL